MTPSLHQVAAGGAILGGVALSVWGATRTRGVGQLSGSGDRRYRYLSLSTIDRYVPAMRREGVSEVARSRRGFLPAYRRANGRADNLPERWRRKRRGFIARHMAQVKKRREPLYNDKGEPTRRHLALIAWAYSPSPEGL